MEQATTLVFNWSDYNNDIHIGILTDNETKVCGFCNDEKPAGDFRLVESATYAYRYHNCRKCESQSVAHNRRLRMQRKAEASAKEN